MTNENRIEKEKWNGMGKEGWESNRIGKMGVK